MCLTAESPEYRPERDSKRILDIRPDAAYRTGHLPGAVSLPLEPPSPGVEAAAHYEQQVPSIFLPPREVPLLVVGAAPGLARDLAAHLQARGRAPVAGQDVGDLPAGALTESGPCRAHLWAPPPWLRAHANLLPPPLAGPVLDLACGSGRAAVWLAEQGYQVTGIDWQVEALSFGRRLAASRGVNVTWQRADLRDSSALPTGPWAVILNFRYLQRDLLTQLPGLLRPGGVALARTFRDAPGYDGHPQPKHRLAACELIGFFPLGSCEILAHETSHDPDGRPAAGIVARRRVT